MNFTTEQAAELAAYLTNGDCSDLVELERDLTGAFGCDLEQLREIMNLVLPNVKIGYSPVSLGVTGKVICPVKGKAVVGWKVQSMEKKSSKN